jgi:hypothetical protein
MRDRSSEENLPVPPVEWTLMQEVLEQVSLKEKYLDVIMKAGIRSIDDFMECDPEDLAVLQIEESDLAVILLRIQAIIHEEDSVLERNFEPSHDLPEKANFTIIPSARI